MGISNIMMLMASILIAGLLGKVVAPSAVQQIKATKVDTQVIQTEKAIYEAVCRYITLNASNPTSLNDLITANLFPSASNNNGFGGTYSISIDSTKGTLTITTDIADSTARTAFINSYKNTFKPVQGSGNYVNTTFVLPTSVMHGNGQFMAGIPVQSTAPSASTNKYWYDTSGTEAVLKMSDGSAWKAVSSPSSSSTSATSIAASSIVASTTALSSTTGTTGDIKYVYDSASNTMQQYAYYNGGWVLAGAGGAGSTTKYIKIVNGARQWSDNTYATSCLNYIQSDIAGYNYTGDTGDGVYKIDPDGTGGNAAFDVYCDQTTDGGGWTYITYLYNTTTTPSLSNSHLSINYYLDVSLIKLIMNNSSSILFREDISNTLAKTTNNTFLTVKNNINNGMSWFYNTHNTSSLDSWLISINSKNIPYAQLSGCNGYLLGSYQIFNSCGNSYGSHTDLRYLYNLRAGLYTNSTIHFIGFK